MEGGGGAALGAWGAVGGWLRVVMEAWSAAAAREVLFMYEAELSRCT